MPHACRVPGSASVECGHFTGEWLFQGEEIQLISKKYMSELLS